MDYQTPAAFAAGHLEAQWQRAEHGYHMDWLLLTCLICFVSSVIVIWTAGDIFFDVGRASTVGGVLAAAWVILVLGTFAFWQPLWKPFVILLLFSTLFLRWWFSQQPSHRREWDANFSRLPRVGLEGDTITIENVRNTEYRTIEDCTPQYDTRTYRLSRLRGVDALVLYWGSTWISHPMFVFDFGPDGRLCISIEVRYRVGQKYDFFRSLYRQQELIYIVCDERDAILRRTKCLEGHDLYLYRLHTRALAMRQFFLEYMNSINSLAEQPRWYHGLTTNCTTSIYAQGRGRMRWDWRILFNGAIDRLMYDRKLLDQELPLESLKKQSWVNDIANSAPADVFGDYIRSELPGYGERVDRDCNETEMHGGRQT